MKYYVFTVIIAGLLIGKIIFPIIPEGRIAFTQDTESPDRVLEKYYTESEVGNFQEIDALVTEVPAKYWAESIGDETNIADNPRANYEENADLTPSAAKANTLFKLVKSDYPKTIFDKKEYIKQFVVLNEKKNIAKIKILVGSRDNDNYELSFTYFLVKEQSWKIFMGHLSIVDSD